MKKLLLFFLSLFAFSVMAQEISLIPQPAEVSVRQGKFLFAGKVVVAYPKIKDFGIGEVVDKFVEDFEAATGVALEKCAYKRKKSYSLAGVVKLQDVDVCKKKADAHILLFVDEAMGDEAYALSVTDKKIVVTAAKPAGFFYAFQTLKQLTIG